jgi:excisionase family DNA binding protein
MNMQTVTGPIPSDLITLSQAANRLKVSSETIRLWINRGRIQGYRAGLKWQVSESAVLALMQTQTA